MLYSLALLICMLTLENHLQVSSTKLSKEISRLRLKRLSSRRTLAATKNHASISLEVSLALDQPRSARCEDSSYRFPSSDTKTTQSPFLFLALDLPRPPLFQDSVEKNIIPQVSLSTVLAKYDGATTQVRSLAYVFSLSSGIPTLNIMLS